MTSSTDIKKFLSAIGFSLEEAKEGVWIKSYSQFENYKIRVSISKKEIDYGTSITLGDKTTSNFQSSENFVVLECVNRIIEKGYHPKNITLEKDYPLGHKSKGKLDILVCDNEGKAFLMIECKTWGTEYTKACKNTLKDGGQLLSYFQQDKASQYLSLYTSQLENGTINFQNGIIKVEPEFREATNTAEVFEKWNKNLKDNGIFESTSTSYNIVIRALTKDRLIPLTKDDSSRIFNQFAEILRHNVVSDKPNAFNKLITLLLCKIVDEDREEDAELHFQWIENDTDVALQKRLNDLYKIGMERYLTKVVTDYSDTDVENIVGLNAEQKDIIKHMMTQLRLKKNNEFAFKEVFNDTSFEENGKVLREVVELLQPYKVRYNKKHQFLGDFFELLLNTSIKQEAGQYFTPVPIARFIINSLPLKEIILKKIAKGDNEFLPYVIDYAVGSGHFLTEAMDEIHNIISQLNISNNFKPSIKNKIKTWAETDGQHYDWAYNFIYGIEKDYRLVKTAKVSCFLNGDGLARIFNADGLANFSTCEDYLDKLKMNANSKNGKDNPQFDVLIANPPYSVSSFKNTLKDGEKSFDLYNRLTDDSSEIECLFVERAKQLLKDDGYAGIILPNSIIGNSGIYTNARDILLKYFKIISITEFGSNTFMATGTNTVALFLQRRNNSEWQKIEHAVSIFFTNANDVTCNGIEKPFSKYVNHVYNTISYEDYLTFVNQTPNKNLVNHELFVEYRSLFDNSTAVRNLQKKQVFKDLKEEDKKKELNRLFLEEIIKIEKEKILIYILAFPQKTLLIKANPDGKNETEKEFLGYEFSTRRGHEGIKSYGGLPIKEATKLYDESNLLNPNRANSYINKSFLNQEIKISPTLEKHISQHELVDIISFDRTDFIKAFSLAVKKKLVIQSKFDLVKLDTVATFTSGVVFDKKDEVSQKSKNIILTASNIDLDTASLDLTSLIYLKDTLKLDAKYKLVENDIFICTSSGSISHLGKSAFIDKNTRFHFGGFCGVLRITKGILPKYLFAILNTEDFRNFVLTEKGQNINNLKGTSLLSFKIPLPPIKIQQKIVDELEKISDSKNICLGKLNTCQNKIFEALKTNHVSQISALAEIRREKIEPNKFPNTVFNYIGLEHIQSNTGKIINCQPTIGGALQSTKNVFKKGDLLYAKLRPYLNKVFLTDKDGICSTDIIVLKSNYAKLLKYRLLDKSFVEKSSQLMKGANLPRLQVPDFMNFKLTFPLKEFKKVLTVIEKVEKEKAKYENDIEQLESKKLSILTKNL